MLAGRYATTARERLAEADSHARSHLETRVRLCLKRAGLSVETGFIIDDLGETDTLIEGWLLAETDGFEYHSSKEQFIKDRRRDQTALAHGYIPLRLTYDDVAAGEKNILRIVGGALRGVAHSSRVRIPENPVVLRNLGWT